MAFWKQDKSLPITNKQHLTASQQEKILRTAKLSKTDIKLLKQTSQDKSLLNPNKRISLNKMKQVIKQAGDPKLAQKINKAFATYQKEAEKYVNEFCQEQYEIDRIKNDIEERKKRISKKDQKNLPNKKEDSAKKDKIKANIKKTREYDRKRQRSEEYMKERMADLGWTDKTKTSALKKSPSPGQKDIKASVSARRWDKQTIRGSAQSLVNKNKTSKKASPATSISDFEKLKKEADELPDLPI